VTLRVVVDRNLSPRLAASLGETGWAAEHWSEVGDRRATDEAILTWARANGAVVVTHDLDFGAILAATGLDSPSVVKFRTQNVLAEALLDRLRDVLRQHETVLERGALVTVDRRSNRLRVLPLRRQ
jgi:predicted nuclease of predicted toxin-antitoxin system